MGCGVFFLVLTGLAGARGIFEWLGLMVEVLGMGWSVFFLFSRRRGGTEFFLGGLGVVAGVLAMW